MNAKNIYNKQNIEENIKKIPVFVLVIVSKVA